VYVHATATTHDFAGNKTRLVAHEKEREISYIFGLADATHWRSFFHRTEHFVRVDTTEEFIIDQTRRNRVDAHAMFAHLGGHCSRVAHDSSFGGAVMRFAVV